MGLKKLRTAPRIDLTGKHVVVTGASPNSLGYFTAQTLANWGAKIIITTRQNTHLSIQELKTDASNEPAAIALDGHNLDLSDAHSVNKFTDWYLNNYGERLDILVNNAGIHLDLMSKWKRPNLTPDGNEIHWRTNYLGTVHLTHNLLPLLRSTGKKHGEARIVNVCSQLHSKGQNTDFFNSDIAYNSWRAYGTSKLALIHFSNELQEKSFKSDNLKVYSLHPGGMSGVRTNIADKGLAGHSVISALKNLSRPLERLFMATIEQGAQTQIFCATSQQAKGGYYYQNCQIKNASPQTLDINASNLLWHTTVNWVDNLPDVSNLNY